MKKQPRLYVDFKKKKKSAPKAKVESKATEKPACSAYWDSRELAQAAEEYIAFFERCAESPALNAARKRLEGLIQKVRGS